MRKIFSTMMLVAAAAMAFVSCQKEEQNAPQSEQGYIIFTSANPDTKTEHNGETIVWSMGDKIRVACFSGDQWAGKQNDENGSTTFIPKFYASAGLPEATEAAEFALPIGGNDEFKEDNSGAKFRFYAVYPSNYKGSNTGADFTPPVITYTISSTQVATSESFDKGADILWGDSRVSYSLSADTKVQLWWTRLVAHAYITLKGLPAGEVVNSVTLTAQEGAAVVGKYNLDITKGEVTDNKPTNSVTVNCTDVTVNADGEATFWACINPCKVESLNIVVDTDKAVYSIDKTNLDLDFLVNKRNIQPVNMSTATRTEKVIDDTDYSGEWLITGMRNEVMYAAKAFEASNTNLKSLEVVLQNETFTAVDGIQNCKMTIAKVTEGDYAGRYTITDANGLYLCSGTGDSNSLVGKDALDEGGYWAISQIDGIYKLVSASKSANNEMRFNSASNRLLFNCYAGTQSAVTLYPFSMVVEDTTPKITVESNAINVAADAQTTSFTYTVSYVTGPISVAVSEENKTILNVSAILGENNTVSVTFDANNDATEKTATIVLSYEGAESVEVTITQAAKQVENIATWTLVTDASTLAVGDQIVIVAADYDYALSTEQKASNRGQASVVKKDGTITFGNDVQIITLQEGAVANTFAFYTGAAGYLYAASSSGNHLKTKTALDANGSWKVEIASDAKATITAQGTNTRNKLQYYSSSGLFSCYSTTQKSPSIYKLQSN